MNTQFDLYFDEPKAFELKNVKPLIGLTGLYFISTTNIKIQYPFNKSRLLYIGMSETKTNGIGNRLVNHFEGKSKNKGIVNYRKIEPLKFTTINFEMIQNFWSFTIKDFESYFILDFIEKYGVFPICNNTTGYEILNQELETGFNIDWKYFD
jgi:hypothetical protein